MGTCAGIIAHSIITQHQSHSAHTSLQTPDTLHQSDIHAEADMFDVVLPANDTVTAAHCSFRSRCSFCNNHVTRLDLDLGRLEPGDYVRSWSGPKFRCIRSPRLHHSDGLNSSGHSTKKLSVIETTPQ